MRIDEIGEVGGAEVDRLMERIAARSGYTLWGDLSRPERVAARVSRPLKERIDVLAEVLGKSRSETAAWVMLVGVSALEDELVEAWKDVHET